MAIQVQSERRPSEARPPLYVIDLDPDQATDGDGRRRLFRRRRLARRARHAVEAFVWLAGSACLCLVVFEGAAGLFR
jgi:hypothetical protein